MKMAIFNSICYTIGWIWSVLLGIYGHPFLAILGVTLLILAQLLYTKMKSPILFVQDFILMMFAVIFGTILEMIFMQIGVISYIGAPSTFPPIWIIALYPLFSLLMNHSLRKITQSQALTFAFGFFLAPLSYLAGKALGGLTFHYATMITWILIGFFWGFFLCILRALANSIEQAAKKTWNDKENKGDLKLFYDGDCPICNREVCHLQKRKQNDSMKFIDITSKNEFLKESGKLDYETAMSQMHALDEKGNLLVGLDAFSEAYARCNLPIMATILNIQFLRPLLDRAYRLFAKNRLLLTGRKSK